VAASQQHGAAARLLAAVQVPGVVRGLHAVPVIDLGVEQLAERPAGDERLDRLHGRVPAEHETGQALDAGLGHRVAQRTVFLHRQGHRLFDQQVLAAPSRGDSLLGVDVARTGDVHGVDLTVVQDFLEIVTDCALQVELIRESPRAVQVDVADGHNLRARILQPAGGVGVGHPPRPVYRHSQFTL